MSINRLWLMEWKCGEISSWNDRSIEKRKAHRIELNYEIIRQKLCEKCYVLCASHKACWRFWIDCMAHLALWTSFLFWKAFESRQFIYYIHSIVKVAILTLSTRHKPLHQFGSELGQLCTVQWKDLHDHRDYHLRWPHATLHYQCDWPLRSYHDHLSQEVVIMVLVVSYDHPFLPGIPQPVVVCDHPT